MEAKMPARSTDGPGWCRSFLRSIDDFPA